MKEIEFMQLLLEDAVKEIEYKKMYDEAEKTALTEDRWMNLRAPSIARIEDDLRMIRRITLQLERGLRQ